jgi:hypothetical protein
LGPTRGLYFIHNITEIQYNVFGNDANLKKNTSIFIINIITKKLQSIFLKGFHFEIGHLPSRHLNKLAYGGGFQIMSVFFLMFGEGRFDWGVMLFF